LYWPILVLQDRRGVPVGHTFPIVEVRVAAGARQIIALPGLPAQPNTLGFDLGPDDEVRGLV